MKLTLDVNCLINLHDKHAPSPTSVEELEELVELSRQNNFEIAVTTRAESDLENDPNLERRQKILDQVEKLEVVGSILRWDVSMWDKGDVWTTETTALLMDEIQKIVFPGGLNRQASNYGNKVNDIDHLVGHKINDRDIFITDDKAIWKKADALRTGPGIIAMKPADCLDYLKQQVERRRLVPLEVEQRRDGYEDRRLKSHATFDYSNNNGSYVIGHGSFIFETKWTGAGSGSIHAYTDAASISGVALAKSVKSIEEITNASTCDFSSRVRTPKNGEIIIFQNTNGFFAAIKVLEVLHEDHGDPEDRLEFEFIIDTTGTGDFS